MSQPNNLNYHQTNDFKMITEMIMKHYKLFLITTIISFMFAFLLTRYSVPIYEISSSILIKEDNSNGGGNVNDYINSNLFGKNQNFQNELWVLQSSPVIKETAKNLDLTVNYYKKD